MARQLVRSHSGEIVHACFVDIRLSDVVTILWPKKVYVSVPHSVFFLLQAIQAFVVLVQSLTQSQMKKKGHR